MPAKKLTDWLTGTWPRPRRRLTPARRCLASARHLLVPLRMRGRPPPPRSARRPRPAGAGGARAARDANATSQASSIEVVSTGFQSAAARRPTTAAPTPVSAAWTTAWRRTDDQSGSTPPSSRNDGRKIATTASAAPATPFGAGSWIAPRYAENVEERPGHRLREPVAGEEVLLAHPPGRDDRVVEQRQHDVAAAEHERAGAEHGVERAPPPCQPVASRDGRQPDAGARRTRRGSRRPPACEPGNGAVRPGGHAPPRKARTPTTAPSAIAAACPPKPSQAIATAAAASGEREPGEVGRERAAHREHGERDHGHRDELEPVHPPRAAHVGRADRERERGHRHRRRQREPDPRGEPAQPTGAARPDRDPELAGRRPRQEVRDGDELRELPLVDPPPPLHVLVAEVPDVRGRAAERREAQPQGDREDLAGAPAPGVSPVSRPASRAARRGPRARWPRARG